MAGFQVVSIESAPDGGVDLEKLQEVCGEDTAGLMLTNPNTVGLFDKNILKITEIVHNCGGLCYYDGANLNAVMGTVCPGDMGFDVIHLNLHKTFSTPHGGGGPGSGPVGCKSMLVPFLPSYVVDGEEELKFVKEPQSIGEMKSFYGNFTVIVKALTYVKTLGREGIPEASQNAVLNANYMMNKLKDLYTMAYDEVCMHEFVMSLADLKKKTGISAMDIAKGLLDNGIHPPTMYFPLIVEEALMVEPTETETRGLLVAYNKADGTEVWKKHLGAYAWSSPLILYDDNGDGYVVQCDSAGHMYLFDGRTGETLDRLDLEGNFEASPAAFDNMIVVGTRASKIYGVKLK